MNRMKATGIASLLTAGLMLGGTLPATAANQYDIDAPAINYTLVSGDYDTEGKAEGPGGSAATGTLACVPGKASYAVGYVGVLDMSKVISKWNSLKGLLPLGSLILGRDMTPYFRALSVTSDPATQQYNTAGKTPTKDFTWSFKIANPELVTVDLSAVDTVAKFTALYQAANSGTTSQFARLMVPSTGLSYDASTGVFSATFKLVDGLTAGTLDDAYQAMKEPLLFPTPAGMINVSAAKLREMSDNGTALVENEPTVNGIFSAKHPTNFALNGFIGGYFPMTFGQNTKGGVRETSITAKVTATSSHSFKSEDGSALPAEVTALVPSAIHGQNVADAVTAPTSTFSDVKVTGGKWTFVGWGTSAKWNDDIATAPDCKIASHVGTWKYVADPAPTPAPTTPAPTPTVAPTTPAPTPTVAPTTPAPTPTVAPTTPAPVPTAAPTTPAPKPSEAAPTTSPEKPAPAPSKKPAKAKKKLAHTGATVAGLGFVALAFGGAGVLIVRRRYQ